jgi:coatomer protein complex subunit alpha (xenin)
MGTLIDRFDEHEGPVRGVHFHATQPLFASGGDDYKVKVWNYKLRRCLFTLLGHLDYIRTVQFHSESPWLVSASDDQTIRVWNWQSRQCLAVLTGHNHYVMCASFHPREDLVVSASLDQTVRVWDIAALRKKGGPGGGGGMGGPGGLPGGPGGGMMGGGGGDDGSVLRLPQVAGIQLQVNADLFGGGAGDAVVKYVLEGHDRGVNWASFHPTLPLIVSGADDRQVKLWRYNETKAWEVDTLRGHTNNVSCVLFHARSDLIVSDSEDRSVRVWDMSRRTGVQTFRREHDRFWILAAHPEVNLLAAGHDSGMIVFKLERERPAYAVHGQSLFYVRERTLRLFDGAAQRDNPLAGLRRGGGGGGGNGGGNGFGGNGGGLGGFSGSFNNVMAAAGVGGGGGGGGGGGVGGGGLGTAPRTMSYNPAENAVLLTSDADGGTYELLTLPKPGAGEPQQHNLEPRRGAGACAVFIARNRFAVLDRSAGVIQVRNLQNEITKKVQPPCATVDAIFYAGTGLLLCRAEDRVILFDVQQRAPLAELATPFVKYVAWSPDMERVALLSKHAIVVADKRLQNAQTVHETIRVKSAAWDEHGVLLYSTLNHLKYCLPTGDSGIVRTLEQPLYVARCEGGVVTALDREGRVKRLQVDASEYLFKLALAQRRYEAVIAMIRSGALCGAAITAYLQHKGYPEVALHFTADPKSRFALAVACGNIEVALAAAQQLDAQAAAGEGATGGGGGGGAHGASGGDGGTGEVWYRLGVEALRQGNFSIVEFAYQRTKAWERLAFLYLATGHTDKLRKMLKIAEMRGDAMARFQNALYLGDGSEQVKVLEEAGHVPLAYVAASVHGLREEAERLAAELPEGEAAPEVPAGARVLAPPAPLTCEDNWPLLTVTKGFFETLAAKGAAAAAAGEAQAPQAVAAAAAAMALDAGELEAAGWGDDDDDAAGLPGAAAAAGGGGDGAGGGDGGAGSDGWDMEDLELPPDVGGGAGGGGAAGGAGPAAGSEAGPFVAPPPGVPASQRWLEKRTPLAAEAAAAGDFATAMSLLRRQIGAAAFGPLREPMLELAASSHATLPALAMGLPPVRAHLDRRWSRDDATQPPTTPALLFSMPALEERVKGAYKLVTDGKFADALRAFVGILQTVPLMAVETRRETDEVKELVAICREYSVGLRCEVRRKELAAEAAAAAPGSEEAAKAARGAAELAAYFTHCRLQPVHLALALRSAMTVFYKQGNLATCAHFCRRLLELSPPEKMAAQARQVLAACEKTPKDADPDVNYDPRNPFDVCCLTFSPVYRGSKFALDPYTGARFQPECAGQLSPLGEFVQIGADASGLTLCAAAAGGR